MARTMNVTSRAPSRAAAATAERAVAPEPTMTAERTDPTPTSRSAWTIPWTSVLSPTQPSSERTSVLIAPVVRATSLERVATSKATSLSGIVRLNPRQLASRPATWATKASDPTSTPS